MTTDKYLPAVYSIGRKQTAVSRRRALLDAALEANGLPRDHRLRETARRSLDDPKTHRLTGWGEISMQLFKATRVVGDEVEKGNWKRQERRG